jgi:hypothetical protein
MRPREEFAASEKLVRVPDWEPRLAAEIERWAALSYAWGTADCGRFAAACVEAVTGSALWPKLPRYGSEAGLARALGRGGFSTLGEAVSACLGEPIPPLAAHRGDVLWDGQAVGVLGFSGPLVFAHEGLVQVARESLVSAWAVGRVLEPAGG